MRAPSSRSRSSSTSRLSSSSAFAYAAGWRTREPACRPARRQLVGRAYLELHARRGALLKWKNEDRPVAGEGRRRGTDLLLGVQRLRGGDLRLSVHHALQERLALLLGALCIVDELVSKAQDFLLLRRAAGSPPRRRRKSPTMLSLDSRRRCTSRQANAMNACDCARVPSVPLAGRKLSQAAPCALAGAHRQQSERC
jgi:hypothetical protein